MSLTYTRYRVQVTADNDPAALPRLIAYFQNLNLVPSKVLAEWNCFDRLYVEIDAAGLPEETVRLIVAKMREIPCILNAHWYRI